MSEGVAVLDELMKSRSRYGRQKLESSGYFSMVVNFGRIRTVVKTIKKLLLHSDGNNMPRYKIYASSA